MPNPAFSFEALTDLRGDHATLRLLNASNAPLILSFFHQAFIAPNVRSLRESDALTLLDHHLDAIRSRHGDDLFPKSPRQYLDDWAADGSAYLRRTLPRGKEEPEFDLTPAAERTLEWIADLEPARFIGTESRLTTLVELLRALAQGTNTDREARLTALRHQAQRIARQIERVEHGDIETLSDLQVQERYLEIRDLARRLLGDFRQVEENFRQLDRHARERIALADDAKGQMLDTIFGAHDTISQSEQGESFRAFWSLLMSPAQQDELDSLVDAIRQLTSLADLVGDDTLDCLRPNLIVAGEKAHATLSKLVGQLRRFVDDQAWLEDRRLMTLIKQVERAGIALTTREPGADFIDLSLPKVAIALPFERKLHRPQGDIRVDTPVLASGRSDADPQILFEQFFVDEERLLEHIDRLLTERPQVTLPDVVERFELEEGLAELVAYLRLATSETHAHIDETQRDEIAWHDGHRQRVASVPRVVFIR